MRVIVCRKGMLVTSSYIYIYFIFIYSSPTSKKCSWIRVYRQYLVIKESWNQIFLSFKNRQKQSQRSHVVYISFLSESSRSLYKRKMGWKESWFSHIGIGRCYIPKVDTPFEPSHNSSSHLTWFSGSKVPPAAKYKWQYGRDHKLTKHG